MSFFFVSPFSCLFFFLTISNDKHYFPVDFGCFFLLSLWPCFFFLGGFWVFGFVFGFWFLVLFLVLFVFMFVFFLLLVLIQFCFFRTARVAGKISSDPLFSSGGNKFKKSTSKAIES